jgi:F-type H+-transporting ATPase subunit a
VIGQWILALAEEKEEEGGSDIEIGHHVTREFLGMTVNIDTIWTTLLAGTIVVLLGFWAKAKLTEQTTDHVPT